MSSDPRRAAARLLLRVGDVLPDVDARLVAQLEYREPDAGAVRVLGAGAAVAAEATEMLDVAVREPVAGGSGASLLHLRLVEAQRFSSVARIAVHGVKERRFRRLEVGNARHLLRVGRRGHGRLRPLLAAGEREQGERYPCDADQVCPPKRAPRS